MTAAERLHIRRIKSLPCIRCGWRPTVFDNEAHHCGTHMGGGRCHFATIPLCPVCHRGPKGAGHAPGLKAEELYLLRRFLGTLPIDYRENVQAEIHKAWKRRLASHEGARYREVLE